MKKILLLITTVIILTGCNNKTISEYTTYTNTNLGYTLEYPKNWLLTEIPTINLVQINPKNPENNSEIIEPITKVKYLTITELSNPIDQVRSSYDNLGSGRDMIESITDFNGTESYLYTPIYDQSTSNLNTRELLLEHNKKAISIYTQKYDMPEVNYILNSIRFF